MPWQTFWVEMTGDVDVSLRRFTFSQDTEVCPGSKYGHNGLSEVIDRRPATRSEEGYLQVIQTTEYDGHPSWPDKCASCGKPFAEMEGVHNQVWQDPIYRAEDGREWSDKNLPLGALFDAFWNPNKGPDGIALGVALPPESDDMRTHFWFPDSPATNGGAWTRTGDVRANPPTVDCKPSIDSGDYHGHLDNGVLTDPI